MQININDATTVATGKFRLQKREYKYVAFCNGRGDGYEIELLVTNTFGRIVDASIRLIYFEDCDGYAYDAVKSVIAEWKREQLESVS